MIEDKTTIITAFVCGIVSIGGTVLIMDIVDVLSFLPHDTWLYDMGLKHHHTITHQELLERDVFFIGKYIDGRYALINYAAYYNEYAGDRSKIIDAICDDFVKKGASRSGCLAAFS